uniref:Uncharacterized protein n=1 Tax=Steinernema glaseri TaxID=37863 RepID=A0A1I7Z3R0_9BILA
MVAYPRFTPLFWSFFVVLCFHSPYGSPSTHVSALPVAHTSGKDNLYSSQQLLLQKRVEENGVYRNPKVLPVEDAHQIVNDYIDDIDLESGTIRSENDTSDHLLTKLPICADQYELPFPNFVCPLMTMLDNDYKVARRQTPESYGKLIEDMINLDLHPCDHNTSSCVIMALPDNNVLLGCVDDKTGELVPPKNWAMNLPKESLEESDYVFDFHIPNPIRVKKKCEMTADGIPICVRNNLFYKGDMIIQDIGCCCKGDFCGDVLLDQSGSNPLPFIRVEVDLHPDHNKTSPESLFLKLLHDHREPPLNISNIGVDQSRDGLFYNRFVVLGIILLFITGTFTVAFLVLHFSISRMGALRNGHMGALRNGQQEV